MNAGARVFFFGSVAGVLGRMGEGHFLYSPEPDLERCPRSFPFRAYVLDGTFAPSTEESHGVYQAQSLATLHVFHGWTVLSMWDRSGDRRGASSSTFIARASHKAEHMVSLVAAAFPSLWSRINAAAPVTVLGDGLGGCDTCDVQTPAKAGT